MGRAVAAVVGAIGARGGAGTSTVTAALADGLRRAGRRTVLVDLETRGGGIDVLLGIDHRDGPRWSDLRDARGAVDGPALAGLLPTWRHVPVLSAHRADPVILDDGVVVDVCSALADACDVLVLDLPRSVLDGDGADSAGTGNAALVGACDTLLLVTPLDLPSVAGAVATAALATRHGAGRALRLVARRPAPGRLDPWDVSDVVGLPLAAVVPWDRGHAARVERGEGPDVRARRPLGRAGSELAVAVGGAGVASRGAA
ncbi:septum site-determining protein Ssd [Oerskovia rustica]|uniref:Pilus assembly protein FlpE n=1 Tax=Oerskovia rustica TaxID=2762237 RepID=A0ABR8RRP9_9CELL|nr:septum site-determining protein Ssd [Oerskovia rustica]MBD7950399.1 pilus assembly protein FlpE [Oerskovia rustica]